MLPFLLYILLQSRHCHRTQTTCSNLFLLEFPHSARGDTDSFPAVPDEHTTQQGPGFIAPACASEHSHVTCTPTYVTLKQRTERHENLCRGRCLTQKQNKTKNNHARARAYTRMYAPDHHRERRPSTLLAPTSSRTVRALHFHLESWESW